MNTEINTKTAQSRTTKPLPRLKLLKNTAHNFNVIAGNGGLTATGAVAVSTWPTCTDKCNPSALNCATTIV